MLRLKKINDKEKIEIVELILNSPLSIKEIVSAYNTNRINAWRWLQKYNQNKLIKIKDLENKKIKLNKVSFLIDEQLSDMFKIQLIRKKVKKNELLSRLITEWINNDKS